MEKIDQLLTNLFFPYKIQKFFINNSNSRFSSIEYVSDFIALRENKLKKRSANSALEKLIFITSIN